VCQIFSSQDASNYESETRSIRIDGQVTSIRLERMFWATLEDLSRSQRLTLPQFVSQLYDEVLASQGEVRNFTSLLRCCCLIYRGGAQPGRTYTRETHTFPHFAT
jgi:predicted DNA-binding ribbon-helix-helix protein